MMRLCSLFRISSHSKGVLTLAVWLASVSFVFGNDDMCLKSMKVRGVNYFSPSQCFVPCGKCAECRDMLRSGWSFRLRAEVQQRCIKEGWHCGFATFTYNDAHLPYLPQELFNGYDEQKQIIENGCLLCDVHGEELHTENYKPVPCFSKEDCRALLKGVKRFLGKYYSNDFVYFLATEYGSNTQRPHLHGLFCWSPEIPDSVIYGLLRDYWTGESNVVLDKSQERFNNVVARPNRGFICPRQIEGYNYLDVEEKPFVVTDPMAAANYCAKYACKDLYFESSLKDIDIDRKDKRLRDYMCFHMQTKSLGKCILDSLSDSSRLQLYKDGYGFLGEERLSPLPIYLRNKLLFKPYYYKDSSGRRLVRRLRTDFFDNNMDVIFEKKVEYYEKIFESAKDSAFFNRRFVPPEISIILANNNKRLCVGASSKKLAQHYLTYYGLPYAKCYNAKPSKIWASRYDEFGATIPVGARLVNPFYVGALNDVVSCVLGSLNFCITAKYTPETELADKVKDFFSHKSKPPNRRLANV